MSLNYIDFNSSIGHFPFLSFLLGCHFGAEAGRTRVGGDRAASQQGGSGAQ